MGHSCFLGCFWGANMLDWPAPPSRVGRCGQMEHCCFLSCSRGANMLDWPAPPSTVLVRACFWSVRRRGRSFIPEISFREDGNVESHSVRGGIMRYSIFSPRGGQKLDTKLAGVFLVSAKKGAIIYPGDFFQRRRKC